MIRESDYFILYSNCIPVKGARRSTICDLQRNHYWFITNSLYEVLVTKRNFSLKEIRDSSLDYANIEKVFDKLVTNELGFWGTKEELELFPPIELRFDTPSLITNAIVDSNISSQHDYKNIADQLEDLGCKAVHLRFYGVIDMAQLNQIFLCFENTRVSSVQVLMPYYSGLTDDEIRACVCNNNRLSILVFHSAPESHQTAINNTPIIKTKRIIDSSVHCGEISDKLFSINIKAFSESVNYNSCLNKKIAIDVNGEVKNCPSMDKVFGNISKNKLIDVVFSEEFKKVWYINKNQIKICSDCEFRHICTDCRAFTRVKSDEFSKPVKCSYNPYSLSWE